MTCPYCPHCNRRSPFPSRNRERIMARLKEAHETGFPYVTMTDLAKGLRIDRGTVQHHVNVLAREGLVLTGSLHLGRRGKPPRVVLLPACRDRLGPEVKVDQTP